ncbi:hypothetical protein B6U79_03395 [Candidatus Bathyarchaeota archaeon ex4484_231]|nr:MAG: hypothetical protein B6U79_03395 [Candidatus Bathyarchaeota archaeon ex4484_231]RLG89730.1 MAG: hypothetical protein DRO34_06795 [Candidatus Bathyarchaeota archaeon]HDO71955.1 PadR family transcriptional regulator [Candidatus Bathyarchaeota archaeon]HEX68963.1 PadR family transcriptional regulator [Candidatus Bathyarchaeota archaeon]
MVKVVDAFLRGFEKPIILLLLSYKPRHGYELIKEFRTLTGRRLKPSIVYPFLQWLEKEGFAVSKKIERGKRKLKRYSLTEKGEQLLKNLRERLSNSIKEVVRDLIKKKES